LNRSLTGLSAQACPRRSVSCSLFSRAASFSLLTGRFLSAGDLACRFFFLSGHSQACSGSGRHAVFFGLCCALASVRAFFYPGSSPFFIFIQQCMQCQGACRIFFWTFLHSVVSPRARIFYLGVVRSHPAARTEPFFVVSGQQLLHMQKLFFSLSGHFYTARLGAMLRTFFFSSSQPCKRVRGASDFFSSVQSLLVNSSCAHRFFFGHSHTLLLCAQLFVFVSGRCLPF
jgi:hypothetical protein